MTERAAKPYSVVQTKPEVNYLIVQTHSRDKAPSSLYNTMFIITNDNDLLRGGLDTHPPALFNTDIMLETLGVNICDTLQNESSRQR